MDEASGQGANHGTERPVEAGLYREAMSRLVAAVHVVTTRTEEGRAGFTATAVASVSDTPPTLLVCLNRRIHSAPAFRRAGVFAVNMLAGEQQALAQAFGGRTAVTGETRFAVGQWHEGRLGVPVLAGAVASFECRLVEARTIATHDVLVGRVEAVTLGPDGPKLAYLGRDFLVV
ncbi:flavin reductase [Ancylobacter mangrovi]|uniref:Flavin reductase n=1 Tax=Ancylobacter mangrovi TaxID=2972472 RepID=A0A9X2T634_9HYPH|nr:flavin reductase [Ancylobacter mangrovi]MCS0496014.1 flavin reductase [Ancylobacter mangrovi]MCS0504568.1 flavin reductase [Ancylobacter mangrovi]